MNQNKEKAQKLDTTVTDSLYFTACISRLHTMGLTMCNGPDGVVYYIFPGIHHNLPQFNNNNNINYKLL